MITTYTALTISSNIRYDLLGQAMKTAGIDSGMTKDSSSKVSGFNVSWTASATDYSNIDKLSQLACQTGYGTYNYSVFLRRDGTLPMTGSLNMGSNSITNAVDITASGTVTGGTLKSTGAKAVGTNLKVAGTSTLTGAMLVNNTITSTGNITAGGQLIGHNGGGDAYVIGGGDGNDYEFRLGSNKPLTLWRSGGSSSETRFQVWGNQNNAGDFVIVAGKEYKIMHSFHNH